MVPRSGVRESFCFFLSKTSLYCMSSFGTISSSVFSIFLAFSCCANSIDVFVLAFIHSLSSFVVSILSCLSIVVGSSDSCGSLVSFSTFFSGGSFGVFLQFLESLGFVCFVSGVFHFLGVPSCFPS